MKFYLVNGEIKFLTHKIEWQTTIKQQNENNESIDVIRDECVELYDISKKNILLDILNKRETIPIITEYEQPSPELVSRCEGKTFNTYQEALDFVNGTYEEPLTLESLALLVADFIGGAI